MKLSLDVFLSLLSWSTAAFGVDYGGLGGTMPAPKCKAFKCSAGEKAVRKKGYKPWSYGCKEGGANFMSLGADDFDPNDPLAALKNKANQNFDKCCLEHDACLQTCGMTSEACHDAYYKCASKQCKGKKNCLFQAQMAQMLNQPMEEDDDKSFSADNFQCRAYDKLQKESCECVPKDEYETATEARLKTFYKLYNRDKLDDKGEIKGLDEVKTKWKGKEPTMFLELTKKYKDKAIERRVKPKPKPRTYTPPADEDKELETAETEREAPAADVEREIGEDAPEPFQEKLEALEAKKNNAKADEDYDLAQAVKEEIMGLKADELKRLKTEKAAAVENEDYVKAKELKKKIEALEPKAEL